MPAPVPSPIPVPCPVPAPPPVPGPWLSVSAGASAATPARSRGSAAIGATGATTCGIAGGTTGGGGGSTGRWTGSGLTGRRRLLRLRIGRTRGDPARRRNRAAQRAPALRFRSWRRRRLAKPAPAASAARPRRVQKHEPREGRLAAGLVRRAGHPHRGQDDETGEQRRVQGPGGRKRLRGDRLAAAGGLKSPRSVFCAGTPRISRTARTASAAATNRPSTVSTSADWSIARTSRGLTPAARAISRAVKTSGTAVMSEDMEVLYRRGKILAAARAGGRIAPPRFSAIIEETC